VIRFEYEFALTETCVPRWDGLLVTLASVPDARAYLRVHGLAEAAAADAAAALDLPLTLTKRGCVVYATKDSGR
jgi:hypothetical protein